MAERRPVCLISGELAELPSGDTLPGGGGGGGGGPVIISETGDFTIDPDVHLHGSTIVITTPTYPSIRQIVLPLVADQPVPGYSLYFIVEHPAPGGYGTYKIQGGNGIGYYLGGQDYMALLSYAGGDRWQIRSIDASGSYMVIDNVDP